jgi:hypothetical protein
LVEVVTDKTDYSTVIGIVKLASREISISAKMAGLVQNLSKWQ